MARAGISACSPSHQSLARFGAVVSIAFAFGWGTPVWATIEDNAVLAGPEYEEAQSLLTQRKWAEAAIVLRSVLKSSPDFSPASIALARALIYTGRREEALTVLTDAAQRARGSRKAALIGQARVLSRMFLTNATFQSFQDGMNLLLVKKYRPARDRFLRAVEQEPNNIEILLRLGQTLVLDGDHDSAAERLRIARRLNAHESEVHLWLGRALHQRGELAEAVTELRAARAGLPGSELAPVWLAEALQSSGQRGAAIQALEEDLKAQPFHILALYTLAKIRFTNAGKESQGLWAARKDLQVALSRFEKYVAQNSPRFEGELGLDLRDPEGVKKDIQELLQRVQSRLESKSADT